MNSKFDIKVVERIVTHPGVAHRDEFLACSLADAGAVREFNIDRREPTAEELLNPRVLVLDIGGKYEPHLANFDHHQELPTGLEGACAFTLLARHVEWRGHLVHDLLKDRPWYRATEVIDNKGLRGFAEEFAEGAFVPFGPLRSPIEGGMLQFFAKDPTEVAVIFALCVATLLDEEVEAVETYGELEGKARYGTHNGLAYTLVEEWFRSRDPRRLSEWLARKGLHPDFTIAPNPRGDGYSLFRCGRAPGEPEVLDFSRLAEDPRIHFAHKSGFLAVTKVPLKVEDYLELVDKAKL